MWGEGDEGIRESRALCIMESAFSQSNRDVMQKLGAYVCDLPDLLIVGKILVKQATWYHSPGLRAAGAQWLQTSPLLSHSQWANNYGDGQNFVRIAVDGHTWFSLASVEIHLWVRQHGAKIDLNCSNSDGYASGVCYFT